MRPLGVSSRSDDPLCALRECRVINSFSKGARGGRWGQGTHKVGNGDACMKRLLSSAPSAEAGPFVEESMGVDFSVCGVIAP